VNSGVVRDVFFVLLDERYAKDVVGRCFLADLLVQQGDAKGRSEDVREVLFGTT
jgi:hypothetical protein